MSSKSWNLVNGANLVSGSIIDIRAHRVSIKFLLVADCKIQSGLTTTLLHGGYHGLTYGNVWRMPERPLLAYR